jgi:hypothetical protein
MYVITPYHTLAHNVFHRYNCAIIHDIFKYYFCALAKIIIYDVLSVANKVL